MIGERVPRKEDRRFLTGQGTYLADIELPGMAHAAMARSTVGHALIRGINVSGAEQMPGVVAVFTGADLAAVSNPISHLLELPSIKALEWHVLAVDRVHFVGEPVAIVVAETRAIAEDAVEFIEVDYEELEAVASVEAALAPAAPILQEGWEDNVFLKEEFVGGDPATAFVNADSVIRERFAQHRVIGLPLEGHGACATFDAASRSLLLYSSNQQPHNLRTVVAGVTGLGENHIRVVSPDMGGGFGNKQHFHREELLIAVVAMLLPRPLMWNQDRIESLTASVHSREQIHEVEVAHTATGKVVAVRARILADLGFPSLYFSSVGPPFVSATMLTGAYDIPNYEYELLCVATNKAPMGAYRGFGQPQALFTIERILDLVAEATGLDAIEVRRRNLIPDEPRPWSTVTGNRYDTGSLLAQQERLAQECPLDEFRREQATARTAGTLLGIGFANLVEVCAPNLFGFCGQFGGYEMALVAVQPDGRVNIQCGVKSQGQGHETSLAQVAASEFTIATDAINIAAGDTGILPYGMGTWGSRTAVMGGGVVLKGARQVRAKMIEIAAHLLNAPPSEVELGAGIFRWQTSSVPFADVASCAYLHAHRLPPGMEPGLSVIATYDPGLADPFPDEDGKMNSANTWSTASAAAVVEVDASTGRVSVRDFTIVHDAGRVINPMIVDGQIQGGFAQGLGTVLLEELVYDEAAQPLTTTLMDYLIPSFADVPAARIVHDEHPSELLGGFRGAGEAAIICAPAAIANAVEDAVRHLGVKVRQTALSAGRVRSLFREAGVGFDPLGGSAQPLDKPLTPPSPVGQ